MLPIIDPRLTPERLNFPTKWQAVIFRNYRMVPDARIAAVLGCTEADVAREAARLGLRVREANPDWLTRGFVTVIRSNWYLLPYEQLVTLLDCTEERLEFILKNEDFLDVKLGCAKPACEAVVYSPLTEAERAATEVIAATVRPLDASERRMFDIYRDTRDTEGACRTSAAGGRRMLHPYLTPCADPFMTDTRTHLPDALLDDYARVGINTLLIHGVLSTLSPFPYDPEVSRDYRIRRQNLADLIERAGRRGIGIALYLNEPRTLHKDAFLRYGHPEIAGTTTDTEVHLCLRVKENYDWFYGAIRDLFTELPDIAAVYSTTMSENRTHCHSHGKVNCPRCAHLPAWSGAVLINNTIHKAIRDAGSRADVLNTTWQWTDEMITEGFPHLHPEILVSAVSEWGVPTSAGGIPGTVVDYSIANPGPGPLAKHVFKTARELGLGTNAKVQMSCSWELAALPYLPLFDLELRHIAAVAREGVRDFTLTWTLGSYPSITFDMVADYLKKGEDFSLDAWYEKHFGKDAEAVHEAVRHFCRGYREYPFSCKVAYRSAKNLGVANLWSLTPNSNISCMVGRTFDDIENYAHPYPPEVFIGQFEKLLGEWELGCRCLREVKGNAIAEELLTFAEVAANHFRAEILHARYVLAKRALPESRDTMRAILDEERTLCHQLLTLMPLSPMIGYETSNHYFYTERDVIEKLIQLPGLEAELDAMRP